jgi:hypothetical protein
MSFSLVAWSESQDTAAALTQVAALADQHVTTSGDDVLVPDFAPFLAGYFALGATISLGQMSAPSLRKTTLQDISPLNIGAEPLVPTPWHNRFVTPRPLVPGEGLRALVAEGAAGAEQETVLAWLSDGQIAPVSGEVQTIRCTNASTLVAYAWTLGALTLSQQLEAGRYAIVGMRATSAGLIAARLVIPGSAYRPGCIGYDAASDAEDPVFRNGGLGSWGEFEHTFPPQAEFLSVSADTAQVVMLDVVKIA